jgi:hypothetical protein
MEKTEILKARVSEALQRDFLGICAAVGKSPATQLRTLIEDFVAARRNLLEDDVKVYLDRPDTYMHGVYRARITLPTADTAAFKGVPIAFPLPKLPKRRVHGDPGFFVAASNWNGTGSGLDGVLVDGVWQGHVYTNGIEEEANPTPIADVVAALRSAVTERVEIMRSVSGLPSAR